MRGVALRGQELAPAAAPHDSLAAARWRGADREFRVRAAPGYGTRRYQKKQRT